MFALIVKYPAVLVALIQDQTLVIHAVMVNFSIRLVNNVKVATPNLMGLFVNNVCCLDLKLIVYSATQGIDLEQGFKVGSAYNVQILIVQTVIINLEHVLSVKMDIISIINNAYNAHSHVVYVLVRINVQAAHQPLHYKMGYVHVTLQTIGFKIH